MYLSAWLRLILRFYHEHGNRFISCHRLPFIDIFLSSLNMEITTELKLTVVFKHLTGKKATKLITPCCLVFLIEYH